MLLSLNGALSWFWLTGWLLFLFLLVAFFNVGLLKYLVRMSIMLLAATFVLLFKPLNREDQVLLKVGFFVVYEQGALRLLIILGKALFILLVTLILLHSTPYLELLDALRRLRLPGWILAILLYMFRLFFLMQQEFNRIRRAVKSRSPKLSLRRRVAVLSDFTGVFLARLTERSERSFVAMVSRGFKGQVISVYQPRFGFGDVVILNVSLMYLIVNAIWF